MQLTEKFQDYFGKQYGRITAHYGHDDDLMFRAINLCIVASFLAFVITLFVLFFVFSGDTVIENRSKIVFAPPLVVTLIIMQVCNVSVLNGHLRLARIVFMAFATIIVFAAICFTGGFPTSVAGPVILLPIALMFCFYGGMKSLQFSALYLLAFISTWVASDLGYFQFPDYTSQSSPTANSAAVFITTLAVIVTAFASFDTSVRSFAKRSKIALETKSQFLANMSHEIRTPMNGVLGLSEVMSRTDLNDEQKKLITTIQHSGQALLTIINDILDFSKIDAGKMEFENAPFNLRDSIHDVNLLLSTKVEEKNLQLNVEYDEDVPTWLEGDGGRVRQILLNLVGNAIKFTHEGSVKITVTSTADKCVKIDVTDTGIGIPEEGLASLFEKFTQAEKSTSRNYGGTGLGLAISQRLVQMMNGQISVASIYGDGSTFSITLPLPVLDGTQPEFQLTDTKPGELLPQNEIRPPEIEEPQEEVATEIERPHVLFVSHFDNVIEEHRNLCDAGGYVAKCFKFSNAFTQYLKDIVKNKADLPVLILDSQNKRTACLNIITALRKNTFLAPMQVLVISAANRVDEFSQTNSDDKTHVFPRPYVGGQLLAKISSLSGTHSNTSVLPTISTPKKEEPSRPLPLPSKDKLRILVAEDNEVNQMVMENLLATEGFNITFVDNGKAAVDLYKQQTFDIILMDINMPVMCGEEATKTIRLLESNQSKPPVPIIAVTANVMVGARDRYLEVGMTDYLSKPVRKEALLDLINRNTMMQPAKTRYSNFG